MNALFALPNFDYSSFDIPTPYYVIDRARLRRNMEQFDPDPFLDLVAKWGLPWVETFPEADEI